MSTSEKQTELILNPDNSVYHLKLKPEHVADTVLVVGDQNRVKRIEKYLDKVEYSIENREFTTCTGFLNAKRLTILSTGIGTDNIDIVLNELDAAVNFDLSSRTVKPNRRSLNIIRLGTTGGIQPNIPIDSLLISDAAVGLDGLMNFYQSEPTQEEVELEEAFLTETNYPQDLAKPYIRTANSKLVELLDDETVQHGLTLTASGFYAPQTRELRLELKYPQLFEAYQNANIRGKSITNFEMETSALYGLGKSLGHKCCTICAVIANRSTGKFSLNHGKAEEKLIAHVLGKLTT